MVNNHLQHPPSPGEGSAGRDTTGREEGTRNTTLSPGPERPSSSMSSHSPRQESKLVVLGSSRVGKTALVNQYMHKTFIETYKETVEDFNWIEYENDLCEKYLMKIIDHSGSHDFVAMRDLYIETAHGFLLVCSLDQPSSVDEIEALLAVIKRKNTKNANVIVAINKTDLLPSTELPVDAFLKMHLQQSIIGNPVAAAVSGDQGVTVNGVDILPKKQPLSETHSTGAAGVPANGVKSSNDSSCEHHKSIIKAVRQLCVARGVEFVKTSAKSDRDSVETAFRRIFELMTGGDSPAGTGIGGCGGGVQGRAWTKRRQSTPHHALMNSVNEFNAGRATVDDLQRGRRSSWGVTRLFRKH